MKIKLDENLPARLVDVFRRHGHEADTVVGEGLIGRPDSEVWQTAKKEGCLFITQDLDFSDIRQFQPGTHAGLLLVRLREPGAQRLLARLSGTVDDISEWSGCFVVLSDNKVRVRRPGN